MAGMHTLDTSRSEEVYLRLDNIIEHAAQAVHCYSRLPMRQLLRYVPSNRAEMWWLSDHETPRSIAPDPGVVLEHVSNQTQMGTSMVVLEGIDWLVGRSSEAAVLNMLQVLDSLAKERSFDIVLAGDSLALNPTFWARMCSLAPRMPLETHENDELREPSTLDAVQSEHTEAPVEETPMEDSLLVHLVHLPKVGFTQAVLARRMLQWKRMGFDLAALEPALAVSDIEKSHSIYHAVEQDITAAIDAIRLLDHQRDRMTVSERERFNYRFMSLNNVTEGVKELMHLLSSR